MDLLSQILWGTGVLAVCAVVHVGIVAGSIPVLVKFASTAQARFPRLKVSLLIMMGFVMIVFAHTVQVWIWAISLLYFGALETISTAVYYSLVTYTTLGYGDVVLQKDMRIFGAFAAVTGLLTFGVSAAFLFGLVVRVLPRAPD